MSNFYKHYVDDANVETAEAFLSTLKDSNLSINFTMELAANGKLSFLGMEIFKHLSHLETKVYKNQQILDYYCIIKVTSTRITNSHC